jgi:hypothetical protein
MYFDHSLCASYFNRVERKGVCALFNIVKYCHWIFMHNFFSPNTFRLNLFDSTLQCILYLHNSYHCHWIGSKAIRYPSSVVKWSRPVSRNLQFVGSSQVEADTWHVRALSCFAVCMYMHFHMHEHSGGTWLSEIVPTSLWVFTCFSGTTEQMPGCVLGRDQSVCAIP